MRFRKKPVIVEAVLWNGEYSEGVYNFIDFIVIEGREKICPQCKTPLSKHGRIDTLEGSHIVCPGDWIITGVKGERYPCKPDIFEQTYELIE